MRVFTIPLILSALICGCAVGPNFERPAPVAVQTYGMDGETTLATVQLTPSADLPVAWWTTFESPAIDGLVRDALANSPTLALADARLEQARAMASAARGGLAPQVNANGSAVRERINTQAFGISGFPSPTISLYSLGTTVGFDLNLFGGRQRAIEREEARTGAEQYRVDAAYLTLSGNVVLQAITISGLRSKLTLQTEIVADDRRVFDMVNRAISAGGQPPAALNTIEAQLAEDEASLPVLHQELAEAQHRLALYLGRAPAQMRPLELDLASLRAPGTIPVSLPSSLVRRRPDILAAEADLHAATADIGVETAALYPNISLQASLTQSTTNPETIFQSSSTGWSIGPTISAPIFRGGEQRSRVHRASAAQRAALAVYQQTVLESFVQVADVMQGVSNAQDLVAAQARAIEAAEANVRNRQTAYEAGADTLFSLVDARRQANRARVAAVDARVLFYQNIAALYVATAADWRESGR
jgi:NodT family efflux transporter outer membrane factor (OMF) lipoprotein